jgi:hypothetical protein
MLYFKLQVGSNRRSTSKKLYRYANKKFTVLGRPFFSYAGILLHPSSCTRICRASSAMIVTSVADPNSDPEPPDQQVFGPLDPVPDQLVRGMDLDPDPSIIYQKYLKKT